MRVLNFYPAKKILESRSLENRKIRTGPSERSQTADTPRHPTPPSPFTSHLIAND